MKKITFFIYIIILLLPFLIFSQDTVLEKPFFPNSPSLLAQGGSSTATANGYDALFTNPAGFSRSPGSFTLTGVSAWIMGNFNSKDINAVMNNDKNENIALAERQITKTGLGAGASAGVGFVGSGLGFGIIEEIDSYMYGENILGATGDLYSTTSFIVGYSFPIKIGGITFHLGGDVRPMFRIRAPLGANTITSMFTSSEGESGFSIDSLLNGPNAYYGVGMALDTGVIAKYGSFQAGIAARDVFGTRFNYSKSSLKNVTDSLKSGGVPEDGETVNATHIIPMNVSAGLAFDPEFGILKYAVDPLVHIGFNDVMGLVKKEETSFFTHLHAGAEVKVLQFIKLRAGINQGYFTTGVGLDLLFLDINAAVFTLERGSFAGARPNNGVSIEAAFRF